ncbi:myosin/kinesin family protein [Asaia bogorensis]|uniref:hypothetical protein n=1 Tax=Asaia bogorensis TaxID=91915 RepID=UPI00285E5CB6|nr:hypothetical protein [Asaia bogorensis]MDR6182085.1 hypothetical protein [Asaia bogorensis NBRC 16594]
MMKISHALHAIGRVLRRQPDSVRSISEILADYLHQERQTNKTRIYLLSLEDESDRLSRKMNAGGDVSDTFLRSLISFLQVRNSIGQDTNILKQSQTIGGQLLKFFVLSFALFNNRLKKKGATGHFLFQMVDPLLQCSNPRIRCTSCIWHGISSISTYKKHRHNEFLYICRIASIQNHVITSIGGKA